MLAGAGVALSGTAGVSLSGAGASLSASLPATGVEALGRGGAGMLGGMVPLGILPGMPGPPGGLLEAGAPR